MGLFGIVIVFFWSCLLVFMVWGVLWNCYGDLLGAVSGCLSLFGAVWNCHDDLFAAFYGCLWLVGAVF